MENTPSPTSSYSKELWPTYGSLSSVVRRVTALKSLCLLLSALRPQLRQVLTETPWARGPSSPHSPALARLALSVLLQTLVFPRLLGTNCSFSTALHHLIQNGYGSVETLLSWATGLIFLASHSPVFNGLMLFLDGHLSSSSLCGLWIFIPQLSSHGHCYCTLLNLI